MHVENHSLANEFPEHKERIHELKMNDRHFQRLFDEYHDVDKEIHRLESADQPTTDEHMEELKKQRLSLKDELYRLLQAVA
jgi:hypothetical protein